MRSESIDRQTHSASVSLVDISSRLPFRRIARRFLHFFPQRETFQFAKTRGISAIASVFFAAFSSTFGVLPMQRALLSVK